MLMLVKRNFLLYFRNRSGVFASLLGALISFVLYLIFLKANIKESWSQVPNTNQLLDMWLIGGTLGITGITTTLAAYAQLVKDKESKVTQDLYITDLGSWGLQMSYLLSSVVIGFLMQIAVFAVMMTYFVLNDKISFAWGAAPQVLLLMLLNACLTSLINAIIVSYFKSVDNLGRFASIVGAASGFLVGTYVPIGALPDLAQHLMKLTPSTYIASLFRQVLMKDSMADAFANNEKAAQHFEKIMGIRLHWDSLLTMEKTYYIVVVVLGLAFLFWLVQTALANRRLKVKTAS
ncbi:ABC transporter permease [Streptococcus massiliensis]|uniref:Putative ABC transporter protein n=1 Tax=Streptococcus massiliensis TaxID=313439 RepID=A0A380KYP0_9STRE|nr:ABC transporter permease [Streptococcus massiliensis]SUN76247.1 putative ABC transporter protein [Streptococcus massiliensis]